MVVFKVESTVFLQSRSILNMIEVLLTPWFRKTPDSVLPWHSNQVHTWSILFTSKFDLGSIIWHNVNCQFKLLCDSSFSMTRKPVNYCYLVNFFSMFFPLVRKPPLFFLCLTSSGDTDRDRPEDRKFWLVLSRAGTTVSSILGGCRSFFGVWRRQIDLFNSQQ